MNLINIEDREPEKGKDIIGYTEDGEIVKGVYEEDGDFHPLFIDYHGCGCCGTEPPKISHWSEMPELPKD